MEELLNEQSGEIRSLKHGDVVEGTVVRIDKDEILVDIGAKSEGVVSNRELYGRNTESQPQLSIGDVVLVYVLQPESNEGHAVLSLRRAGLERKWRAMQEQFEAGVIIEAPVIDHNKGGLIVDCGIRGFVPISQIVDFPRRPAERAAARRGPGDRGEAAAVRRPQAAPQDPGGQPQGEPAHPVGEGRALRGAPREAGRAVQQPQGRPARQGLRPLDRPVRRVRRPRRHRRPRAQERAVVEQGQQPRVRLSRRRGGRGRGHRHQPRAWPDLALDPPPPARSVELDRGGPQGRRRHRGHGHEDRQLRRLRAGARGPGGPHPHQRAVPSARRPSG